MKHVFYNDSFSFLKHRKKTRAGRLEFRIRLLQDFALQDMRYSLFHSERVVLFRFGWRPLGGPDHERPRLINFDLFYSQLRNAYRVSYDR